MSKRDKNTGREKRQALEEKGGACFVYSLSNPSWVALDRTRTLVVEKHNATVLICNEMMGCGPAMVWIDMATLQLKILYLVCQFKYIYVNIGFLLMPN
jgi:hypothetical protein